MEYYYPSFSNSSVEVSCYNATCCFDGGGGGGKNFKKNNFLKHLRRTNDVSKKNQNVRTTCTSTSYVVYQGESA